MQKFVLPFIEPAMKATALHRPKNPVEFFSYYLLNIRGQQQEEKGQKERKASEEAIQ